MLQLLTPTGGRPDAWRLSQRWARRQTYQGPVHWVVVDDCDPASAIDIAREGWTVEVVRPTPRWRAGQTTHARNLLAGLDRLDPAHPIAIWEDDDYYAPGWLETVSRALEIGELVGEAPARYYHIGERRWRIHGNTKHASLAASAVRGSAIAALRRAAEQGGPLIDIALWKTHTASQHLVTTSAQVIGMKGMPGRKGIGNGHRPLSSPNVDTHGRILQQWLGVDAAAAYEPFMARKPVDPLRGTGPAIVIGSGRCVWSDLRAINRPHVPTFVVNDMIIHAPRVDHAVSHHPDKLPHWNALRTHAGGPGRQREHKIVTHSSLAGTGIARVWPQFKGDGSSALLAVRIARAIGHDPIYVAGVPLDGSGYVWADPDEEKPYDFARYRGGWTKALETELRGHVLAPSGYLRELLGASV